MTGTASAIPLPPDTDATGVMDRQVHSPSERLILSRERLRSAMGRTGSGAADGPRGSAGGTTGPGWLRRVAMIPGFGTIVGGVHRWWMGHPARVATDVAGSVVRSALRPVAHRHPLALVAAAALAGAAIVAIRPWRWIPKRALVAGILMELGHEALARLPLEGWMDVATSLMASADSPASAAPTDTALAAEPEEVSPR